MGGGHNETPRGLQADTGQESHKANAAGTCKIAQIEGRAKRARVYRIQPEGGKPFAIYAKGRDAWQAAPYALAFYLALFSMWGVGRWKMQAN